MKRSIVQWYRYTLPLLLVAGIMLYPFYVVTTALGAEEDAQPCPTPYVFSTTPRAASAGDKITIRGNRFGERQGTVTFFPGIRAQILEWDYQRILVVVPEHSRTGPLTVSIPCGEVSNEKYFTIAEQEKQ